MYAYQSELWCDTCGESIIAELKSQGISDTSDTEDFPQYADEDYSETDSPSHCASMANCPNAEVLQSGNKCGCLIRESLTREGVKYVCEAIDRGGEVADLWADAFSGQLPAHECDWCGARTAWGVTECDECANA